MDETRGTLQQMDLFDMLSMDSDSRLVLSVIDKRRGREQAIPVATISEKTGIPPRTVRDIVKCLIEKHHARIGSSPGKPSGYYMIQTLEEAERNERTLRKLGISILVHAAVIKGLSVREYLKGIQEELNI